MLYASIKPFKLRHFKNYCKYNIILLHFKNCCGQQTYGEIPSQSSLRLEFRNTCIYLHQCLVNGSISSPHIFSVYFFFISYSSLSSSILFLFYSENKTECKKYKKSVTSRTVSIVLFRRFSVLECNVFVLVDSLIKTNES